MLILNIFIFFAVLLEYTPLSAQEPNKALSSAEPLSYSTFSSSYTYAKEIHSVCAKMHDDNFSSNVFIQAYPEPQLENWGVLYSTQNFTFNAGNILFSGTKSKMNMPFWQTIDVARSAKLNEIYFKSKNPYSATSNADFSTFMQYTVPLQNKANFKPVFSLAVTPLSSCAIFASAKFPFVFEGKTKNKLQFSLDYASDFLESSSSKWFMNYPYFSPYRTQELQEELFFYNKYFSLISYLGHSIDPFGNLKNYNRTDFILNLDFSKKTKLSMEGRLFACQNDFVTYSGKIIREPLHYSVLPKFYLKTDLANFTFGALFDSKYSYSSEYENTLSDFCQFLFKCDFLYWNFSLKYKYKWNYVLENSIFEFSQDENEFYASVWAQIFKSQSTALYTNAYAKFTEDNWLIFSKLKLNQKIQTQNLYTEFSFSLQDSYKKDSEDYGKCTLQTKAKISYGGFWVSGKVQYKLDSSSAKTAADNTDNVTGGTGKKNADFEVSAGFSVKLQNKK